MYPQRPTLPPSPTYQTEPDCNRKSNPPSLRLTRCRRHTFPRLLSALAHPPMSLLEKLREQLESERRKAEEDSLLQAKEKEAAIADIDEENAAMERLLAEHRDIRARRVKLQKERENRLLQSKERNAKLKEDVKKHFSIGDAAEVEEEARAGLVELYHGGSAGKGEKKRLLSGRKGRQAQLLADLRREAGLDEDDINLPAKRQAIEARPGSPEEEKVMSVQQLTNPDRETTGMTVVGNDRPPVLQDPTDRTTFAPSKYCHICGRYAEKASALCSKFEDKNCKKRICVFCDRKHKLDMDNQKLCPHCRSVCPENARCKVYAKSNANRRKRENAKQLEKRQARAEGSDQDT